MFSFFENYPKTSFLLFGISITGVAFFVIPLACSITTVTYVRLMFRQLTRRNPRPVKKVEEPPDEYDSDDEGLPPDKSD